MRHWRMRDKGQLDIIGIIFHEENSIISHYVRLSGILPVLGLCILQRDLDTLAHSRRSTLQGMQGNRGILRV